MMEAILKVFLRTKRLLDVVFFTHARLLIRKRSGRGSGVRAFTALFSAWFFCFAYRIKVLSNKKPGAG